jgi:uncharacterized RDD family membrane protein YckC
MRSQYGSPSQAAAPAPEYVGVGRRLLALIIDGFILLIVGWIIAVVFPSSGAIARGVDAWGRFKHMGPGAVLQVIIPFVYYIIMEALQGATVGKMAPGIRVVKLDGSPMSWGESIVRNLLRIVDQLPYAIPYLLGALLIWKTFVSSVIISTPLTKAETIVVFVTYAIANISAEEVQLCPRVASGKGSNSATIASHS